MAGGAREGARRGLSHVGVCARRGGVASRRACMIHICPPQAGFLGAELRSCGTIIPHGAGATGGGDGHLHRGTCTGEAVGAGRTVSRLY